MEKEFRKIITRLLNSLIEKQELKEAELEPLINDYLKELIKENEIKDTNNLKYLINTIYNHTSINEDDLKDKKSFLNFLKLNFCTCEGCGNLESYTINNFCTTCIEFITTHKEA
ncbi:hypothetical protein GU919_08680 [Campylobacter upsaliensis]|nr:hypothetical protein [Campylobacter upsaliensis]